MGGNGLSLVLLLILDAVRIDTVASYGTSRECNNVESKSTMLQLKRHLLCEYDSDVRPVKSNDNVTRVQIRLIPMFFIYLQEKESFDLHTWIYVSWDDSHLTWEPAQFDNIGLLFVSAYEIWIPDILLHNPQTEESMSSDGFTQTRCWVSKDGSVRWTMPAKYSTYCISDNTWWPYNIVNCTIQFGSWSHSNNEIQLVPHSNLTIDLNLNDYQKNVEWDLLKVEVMERNETYKYDKDFTTKLLSHHFILRRHWGIIHIAYIMPSIVLMVMTLTTLWLEPKSYERMVIANLNFICHILCMQDVHWEAPRSGSNTPKLLIFYERSFAIALFALILTSILRQLQELTSEPPVWLSAATTSILRSRVGQILLVSILDPAATAKIEIDADDNADLVQSSNKKSPWRYVIVLVGWLAFSCVVLAYAVLLGTCFPKYYTVNL